MHIVHGELRKAPYVKTGCGQDGQSTMFIIELSEMIKDRQTDEKIYTNYSAAIFAKSPAQIGYYSTSLVEGNFVVVNCEKLKVDVNDSNGKQYIKLQMENARLEGAKYIENNQGGYQQAPAQQAPNQQGFVPQQPHVNSAPPQHGGFHPQTPTAQQQQPPQNGWPHGQQNDNTPPF